MPPTMRLEGRVAIVTGSTRGIGRAIAETFAAEGARVVVHGRDGAAAVARAAALGPDAIGVGADLETEAGCDGLIAAVRERYDRVDILVNNAGASVAAPADELAPSDWRRILDLDLTAPFLLCQGVAPLLRAGGRGAIVNISSVAAETTPPGRVAYVAAKAGLVALTKALAAEWAPSIRVNALLPAYVETDLVAGLVERGVIDRSALEARSPYGRLGRPEEVARAAAYLASDESEFVTGTALPVDGGWLVYGQNL